MSKLIKITLSVALCILLLPIVASAHAGRTDSSGGHRDKSTGEYHYHHGYPAHNHYDMDGDGIRDCPYDFADKTNHNNSSNNSSNSSNKTNNSTSISENKTEKAKNKITFGKVVEVVLLSILLSLMTLHLLYIVLGVISIIIVWFAEKCFKVSIEESIQKRIFHILLIIGLVIIVPIEILFLLGII